MDYGYPETKKIEKTDDYHGIKVSDPYQWLEDYSDETVRKWVDEQEKLSLSYIKNLPQKKKIQKRLNELLRYDKKSVPMESLKGERIFFYEREAGQEKGVLYTQENENSEKEELINPNKWSKEESLAFAIPSADGKYLAFGKDIGGNEDPRIHIMEVKTRRILDDSATGWKQGMVSWLHDNSGFYYSRRPLKGEVKEGEEYYWNEVYFHKLGNPPSEDKRVFFCDYKKEYVHVASVCEDGKHVLFYRFTFGKAEVYFKKIDSEEMVPIAEGFDADYRVHLVNDKLLIKTDLYASKGEVFITDINNPERENWKKLIPESKDKLQNIRPIDGKLYLEYSSKAHTKIKIFSLKGEYIRDLKLPEIGSANVFGYFTKSNIWIMHYSFLTPVTIYKYNFDKDELELFFKPSLNFNKENFKTEQVEYKSKDGTIVSMFIISPKDIKKDGNNPTLLTGYGGFDISIFPRFSSAYIAWIESGGIIAIPNLRGGGEYGKEWHEAGKLEKKQNVFDDFISAAEWLIDNKYTNPEKLAIYGGSNGGLLVGAATVQRPDLFKVVGCKVPLLDMLRYHRLSLANIWAEEYGNSENPKQFRYLYEYSPYHNIKDNVDYPAILITTSENDARVDPMHALKMVARLQEANPKGEPIFLLFRKSSGHGGGTTLSQKIEQTSEEFAFLMDKVGLD